MSRRAYLYFALTFLLGAIVGGTCVYYYAWSTGHWHRPFNRQSFVSRLKGELNLSDTQVPQLEQILEGSTKKFQKRPATSGCPVQCHPRGDAQQNSANPVATANPEIR